MGDCLAAPAGTYALANASAPTGDCARGHFCPELSTSPTQEPCPQRYYNPDLGAESVEGCGVCTSGFYCPSATFEPIVCPRGFYCSTGLAEPEPCRLGSYGNSTGLRRVEECTPCKPGMFCDGLGLPAPRGPCDPGYFCLSGSYTSAPHAPGAPLVDEPTSIGGLCMAGGYCPLGSSKTTNCPPGTYNNYTGAASADDCQACTPGFYCAGSSNPAPSGECSAGYYCLSRSDSATQYEARPGYYAPAASSRETPCMPGTYNSETAQEECLACPPGYVACTLLLLLRRRVLRTRLLLQRSCTHDDDYYYSYSYSQLTNSRRLPGTTAGTCP